MIYTKTHLAGVRLIDMDPRGDERGFFSRTMCAEEFAKEGMIDRYPQINTSYSARRGTLRGLHFQYAPYAEAKLVKCIHGAIWDVIVDLRGASPTYLQHEGVELTSENRRQIYVPPGFAHAFLTLTDDAEVIYPVSTSYTASAEGGLRYDDPLLGIEWPTNVTTVSAKDRSWPLLDRDMAPF